MKIVCECNRCGKEVPAKDAKRIIFAKAISKNKESEYFLPGFLAKFVETMEMKHQKHYCPDCVLEIKKFIEGQKGDFENENCID